MWCFFAILWNRSSLNNNSSSIIFSDKFSLILGHLSQPGHVMFFARSQWKHLRASTEVERMEADTTSEKNPNIVHWWCLFSLVTSTVSCWAVGFTPANHLYLFFTLQSHREITGEYFPLSLPERWPSLTAKSSKVGKEERRRQGRATSRSATDRGQPPTEDDGRQLWQRPTPTPTTPTLLFATSTDWCNAWQPPFALSPVKPWLL